MMPFLKYAVLFPGLLVALLTCSQCARNSISERDSRREQIRVDAELKRKELLKVAGDYRGTLFNPHGTDRFTVVHLEVKDIPEKVEGQVDPIMVPVLSGYLRFPLNPDPETTQYIGFALEKAEYDPGTEQLDTVFKNKAFGSLVVEFTHGESLLKGTWTAPENATSGTIELTSYDSGNLPSETEETTLDGEYPGYMYRKTNFTYHPANLSLRTHLDPETGIQLSGTLRVFLGKMGASQFLTYQFDKVSFNPTQGQLILKSPEGDMFLSVQTKGEAVSGTWSSDTLGQMGGAVFSKSELQPKSEHSLFEPLLGPYEGRLVNLHPETQLSGPFRLNFSVAQDLSQPSGISITGEMLIYLDVTGTYDRIPFSSVKYDFFTGKLVIRTTEKYQTTLDLKVSGNKIEGEFHWDSHGKVALVEVSK